MTTMVCIDVRYIKNLLSTHKKHILLSVDAPILGFQANNITAASLSVVFYIHQKGKFERHQVSLRNQRILQENFFSRCKHLIVRMYSLI
jgi:hypothetical protein